MQLPHPLYDLGPIMLERQVVEFRSMLEAIGSKPNLSEATVMRLDLFKRLADRFDRIQPALATWCVEAQKITFNINGDKRDWDQIRHVIGPDMTSDEEYGTGHLLMELSLAIRELHEKPASPARNAGLHVMGSAYTLFYSIFYYFHHVHPTI